MTVSVTFLPDRALIGMIHLAGLPGSPCGTRPLSEVTSLAVTDARALAEAGFHALLIENFGDAPFRPTRVDPHTVSAMTVVARAVRAAVGLPIGINVLRNDVLAALAIATACEASFVRVNVHCGAYVTDQGLIEGRADETLRYRRRLDSQTAIFADVHVKHAEPLVAGDLADAAKESAYRGEADGLIVTGRATGKPDRIEDLRKVKQAVPNRPIFVGSGVNPNNVGKLLKLAAGVIAGTAIKQDGQTAAPVDPQRARALVQAARC